MKNRIKTLCSLDRLSYTIVNILVPFVFNYLRRIEEALLVREMLIFMEKCKTHNSIISIIKILFQYLQN